MKETGLLMTPENYTKCEDGTKTQTRRVVKMTGRFHPPPPVCCPYGAVGDRLYIKEGLARDGAGIQYRRDGQPVIKPVMGGAYGWRWSRDTLSPLHMPKWAARLWLEIIEVRLERLHAISEEDAKAEGAQSVDYASGRECILEPDKGSYRLGFRALWESNKIHKPGSWALNPWLWVIGFYKVRS